MEIKYCWRCRMDIPMLDKEESKIASELYAEGFQEFKRSKKISESCWSIIITLLVLKKQNLMLSCTILLICMVPIAKNAISLIAQNMLHFVQVVVTKDSCAIFSITYKASSYIETSFNADDESLAFAFS